MQSYFNQLRRLSDDELMLISEAIDAELMQREEAAENLSINQLRRSHSSGQAYRDFADSTETPSERNDGKTKRRRAA